MPISAAGPDRARKTRLLTTRRDCAFRHSRGASNGDRGKQITVPSACWGPLPPPAPWVGRRCCPSVKTVAQPYKYLILGVGLMKNPGAKRLWRSARGTACAACPAIGPKGWTARVTALREWPVFLTRRGSGIPRNWTWAMGGLTGIWSEVLSPHFAESSSQKRPGRGPFWPGVLPLLESGAVEWDGVGWPVNKLWS